MQMLFRNKNTKEYSLVAFGAIMIVLAIASIVFWPLLIIFALNTLFPVLQIPYTFWTWISVAVLNMTYLIPRYRKGD